MIAVETTASKVVNGMKIASIADDFPVTVAKKLGLDQTLADSNNKFGRVAAPNTITNGLLENPSQLGHIFRNDIGHSPDTPANRQLLLDITKSPLNFAGKDRFGNDVYINAQADGSQIWGYTRNEPFRLVE